MFVLKFQWQCKKKCLSQFTNKFPILFKKNLYFLLHYYWILNPSKSTSWTNLHYRWSILLLCIYDSQRDAHSFHENVNLVFSLFTARLLNNSRDILKRRKRHLFFLCYPLWIFYLKKKKIIKNRIYFYWTFCLVL